MTTLLGSLLVSLGLESGQFRSGLTQAQKEMRATQKRFETIGSNMAKVGAAVSIGITAPFTALLSQAIPAANESAQAMGQVEAALKSMGPVAGRTSGQLADAATELMHLSTFDDDDILRKVTANLLTFGTVAGEQFDRAQRAAVDLSTRMSGDLQGATLLIGKALNDPIKGMGALRKVGIQLTQQQQEQVKGFVAAGDAASAQGIILTELERQFGGSAKAMRDATPGADLKNAWDDFQETVGGVAVKVLPPLTEQLSKVLNAFNDLSPQTQAFAVGAAAVAAAAGPVIAGFGGIVSVTAPMLASVSGMVAAGGLPALAPILIPLAAAVGGVYLAWQHWKKIGPWVDGVVARTKQAATDIDTQLRSIQSSADDMDRRMGMPSKTDLLDGLGARAKALVSEVDGWFRAVDAWAKSVDAAAVSVWKGFERMHARVQAAFNAMVDGISSAVTGKLRASLDWVEGKAKAVGDAFYTLYDRVVGHSYVPDLVDGIAAQMQRLDGVMVAPTDAATKKVADAYRTLRDELRPVMDELFPEARGAIDLERTLGTIERARKGGVLTEAQAGEARRRAGLGSDREGIDTRADVTAGWDEAIPPFEAWQAELPKLPDLSGKATAQIAEQFAGLARDVSASLGSLVQDIKSGDWMGALTSVLDVIGQVAGIIRGTKTPAASTYSLNLPGRAGGGPVLPNRSYLVGEHGPERLDMGSLGGRIVPNHQMGAAGPAVVQLVVGEGQLFEPRVQSVSGAVSVQTVTSAQRSTMRRTRQRYA